MWLTQIKPAGNAINHPENIQPDRTSDRHRVAGLCFESFIGLCIWRVRFKRSVRFFLQGFCQRFGFTCSFLIRAHFRDTPAVPQIQKIHCFGYSF